ncbi:MAG: hypothetical protein EPO68_12425 [Planctomycetota bacterium]|nr:MAG: hypothetical protein EPO68_12425 [Planctomycetota bacterium]
MNIPAWAAPSTSAIARVRNETLHEGLFFGEPLGFAVLGGSRVPSVDGSVPLQMQALVSRLLVALLGIPARDYIESRIDSRQYCAATL